ncbi:MAG TPA: SDR family oxidoreductase [Steroidobacteraceae bacterium]|nr:SDR family oxidoreductase [Steroidobacteraceae bacterium]
MTMSRGRRDLLPTLLFKHPTRNYPNEEFVMDLQLTQKIALVTGSTAGIGNAIATSLAREGASVIVNGRTQTAVDAAVAKIQAETGGEVTGFAGDLSLASAAEALLRLHPIVDILVNNLGIFEVRAFEDISDADWQRFFDVNVLSGARLARLYFPKMLARKWGRVIFISSESGYQIPAEMIHYGMTKAAQIAVARGLAELTAGSAVTVNTVLPGPTRSRGVGDFVAEMAAAAAKTAEDVEREFFQTARPTSLLKRFATPEEVAALVTYVASPLSSATNGAALRVDGGTVKTAF